MNHKEHLLVCLAEECAELQKAATKALRFGIDDCGPGETRTNGESIQHEFNDVLAIIEILAEMDVVPLGDSRPEVLQKKKDKVLRYMKYAAQKGTLQS
jgi:NTP pyrophosphatase (non-canonical NTP hydrolase)